MCRLALGSTELPIKWVLGALSHGVKWPACEGDHFPLSSYEVEWGYAATPSYAFMACKAIKVIYSFGLTECVHVHQEMMYTFI